MGKYKAVLVDTCIYDRCGYNFESKDLENLKKISDMGITILLPDLINNEMIKHLTEKLKETSNLYNKLCKEVKTFYPDINPTLSDTAIPDGNHKDTARQIIQNFMDTLNVETIQCGDFVDISSVTECYFDCKPPFSIGKKKSEFPDAIVLLATRNWAINKWGNDRKEYVLCISNDNDWITFCSAEADNKMERFESIGMALRQFDRGNSLLLTEEVSENKSEPSNIDMEVSK